MSEKLNRAARPFAEEMVATGLVPEDLKARFEALYGEGVYKIRALFDCAINGTWRATAEHDFVTGYGDEITIMVARPAFVAV